MRRILRKVAMEETENLGDVSTLDDPSVVKEIIDAHVQYKNQLSKKKWRNMQSIPPEKEIRLLTHNVSHVACVTKITF